VYRALAGLDSIAQAAGRCNREGLAAAGEVVVFLPPDRAPPGQMRKAEDACRATLHGHIGDPLDRALFAAYFERLYYASDLDAKGICDRLKVDGRTLAVGFRTAADDFRLIDDTDSASVIVNYRGFDGTDDTIDGLLGTLRKGAMDRWLMRKLQRYTVNINRRDALRLLDQGDIEEVIPGLFAQTSDILYHPELGLLTDGAGPGVVLMA
jgi:CRISPR-associated endonuclease/helicase Cas3